MNLCKKVALIVAALTLCGSAVAADEELDDLFDLDAPIEGSAPAGGLVPDVDGSTDDAGIATVQSSGLRLSGYAEFATAYTIADPEHWSKMRARLELSAIGRLGGGLRYKVSGRADVDGAYSVERDFYPSAVRRDQRRAFDLRETYLDFGAGDWEFRLGRQNIVWGEAVGMFMADVVSARDMREFTLPEFDAMRIPQWAARAEYFAGDTHLELVWIPYASYDNIGKPGSDFYPYPVPAGVPVHVDKPATRLSNGNLGLRISQLVDGWDLTAFAYRSRDITPTLYTLPAGGLELRHDRITQLGGTFTKDLGQFVLKGEMVHTHGRSFNTSTPLATFGVEASDTLDYVFGVDIPRGDWRVNLQYYGRYTDDHDPGFYFDRDEHGLTFLINRKLGSAFEAEVLYVNSLNRHDYMLRPKLIWSITPNLRGQVGADLFGGKPEALFGRFDDSDRVYVELRQWF